MKHYTLQNPSLRPASSGHSEGFCKSLKMSVMSNLRMPPISDDDSGRPAYAKGYGEERKNDGRLLLSRIPFTDPLGRSYNFTVTGYFPTIGLSLCCLSKHPHRITMRRPPAPHHRAPGRVYQAPLLFLRPKRCRVRAEIAQDVPWYAGRTPYRKPPD